MFPIIICHTAFFASIYLELVCLGYAASYLVYCLGIDEYGFMYTEIEFFFRSSFFAAAEIHLLFLLKYRKL